MSEPLYVHYRRQLVGMLSQASPRTMQFAYDDEWLRSANRFPISRSLPLDGTFTDSHSQHFFANLLPEGNSSSFTSSSRSAISAPVRVGTGPWLVPQPRQRVPRLISCFSAGAAHSE